MGRGRAKAKQTKVARELKYGGPNTDLNALQAELSAASRHDTHNAGAAHSEPDDDFDEDDDPYAKYYVEDEDDEDDQPSR